MKKFIFITIALVPILVGGLGLYSLSKSNLEDIIICATNNESHYIPAGFCEYYLLNYRGTKDDIEFLDARSGVAFLFEIVDKSKRDSIIKYLVSKGASTNKLSSVDGYPPLHAAIIINDSGLTKYLLEKGADPLQKDKQSNLTAIEFVNYLKNSKPSIDRKEIINILSTQK